MSLAPRRIRLARLLAMRVLTLSFAFALAGCSPSAGATGTPSGSAVPEATPPAGTRGTSSAGASTAPSPSMTPAPTPPLGARLLPTTFSVDIEPGRYFSMPPFEVAFTFEVPESGWQSGHLNGEFFDLQRWDGVPEGGLPSHLVGFAHPDTLQGPAGNMSVGDLTPAAAAALLTSRGDLETANEEPLELVGRDAVRIDVHVRIDNTPIFGGEDGTFRQGVDLDSRFVMVQVGGGLLLLVVQARPADLEAAWRRAFPILESIELED
jgi:hypothetical protein